jgi:hypothetical protein
VGNRARSGVSQYLDAHVEHHAVKQGTMASSVSTLLILAPTIDSE